MSTQNDPVARGTVKAAKLVDAIFGPKPLRTYAIYKDSATQYTVVEQEPVDGVATPTGRKWTGADIFIARGFVPHENRVQVHADPEHDDSALIETWV
jgi:hypothetical protein